MIVSSYNTMINNRNTFCCFFLTNRDQWLLIIQGINNAVAAANGIHFQNVCYVTIDFVLDLAHYFHVFYNQSDK